MKLHKHLALLFVVFSCARAHAADDTNDFVTHFHDDANIPDYVAKVDALIDAGEARIYASMEDEKRIPRHREAKPRTES